MIKVKTFSVGMLPTNTYVITDEATGISAVVDPACNDSSLIDYLDSIGKDKISYVLLTHGHFDHIGYAYECSQKYDAQIMISSLEKPFLSDVSLNLATMLRGFVLEPFDAHIYLNDNDIFSLGESKIQFISTPGHTSGGGCYICLDDNIIFSGDTLFYLSMGRTDFPTGNQFELLKSLRKICDLPGDYKVYPGHNRTTTLSFERENNPYLC